MTDAKQARDSAIITDAERKDLAERAYKIAGGKLPADGVIDADGRKFQVVSLGERVAVENKWNGMQAMAVAPVGVDGKPDYSEIVIAYAGTDMGDPRDVSEDVLEIVDGIRVPGGQLSSALEFYDKVREQYPEARISTTGHSLGGTLGLAVDAKKKGDGAVVFSAPDPSRLLSQDEQQWLRRSHDAGVVVNHRQVGDAIGGHGGDPMGIANYVTPISAASPSGFDAVLNIEVHQLSNYCFDRSGNVVDGSVAYLESRWAWRDAALNVVSAGGDMTPLCALAAKYRQAYPATSDGMGYSGGGGGGGGGAAW